MGQGLRRRGKRHDERVTPHTLFQAGSVSKTVAAAGAMALVERGTLALDDDVNAKLTSWKLPENAFTATQKVTLRRILSHTGGVTVHGFAGIRSPGPYRLAPNPRRRETRDERAGRVDLVPGTKWRCSGGAVEIESK